MGHKKGHRGNPRRSNGASARQVGKLVVTFFWSDSYETVPMENAVVLRTSLRRGSRRLNEFAQLARSEDLAEWSLGPSTNTVKR